MTDTETFEPDGRAIPYAVEGEGPAIVLLPGLGLTVDYLGGLSHSVSDEDFRVVRIGSRRPSGDAVTMGDLAQDVIDVLDHLDIDHAWLGGHAFGGSVARAVALGHHDRVNGVLLLGVEGGDAPATPDLSAVAARFRDDEVEAMQRAAWAPPEAPAADIPVLVVHGADDDVAPATHSEALRRSSPDLVSVVAVEGAGHFFPATHVVATSWAIEDYLDWD